MFELRRAPGPRLRGWAEANRAALLHERRCHGLHPQGGESREGKGSRVNLPKIVGKPGVVLPPLRLCCGGACVFGAGKWVGVAWLRGAKPAGNIGGDLD